MEGIQNVSSNGKRFANVLLMRTTQRQYWLQRYAPGLGRISHEHLFIIHVQEKKDLHINGKFLKSCWNLICHTWIYLASTSSFSAFRFLFSSGDSFDLLLSIMDLFSSPSSKNLNSFQTKLLFPFRPLALFIVTSHIEGSFQHFTRVSLSTRRVIQSTQTWHVSYHQRRLDFSLRHTPYLFGKPKSLIAWPFYLLRKQ